MLLLLRNDRNHHESDRCPCAVDPGRGCDRATDEADLLLRGLAFTEAMSVELPWYEMVVYTAQFVGDALLALWTDEQWLAYRDGPT